MNISITNKSINAKPIKWKPKKITLQIELKNKWIKYIFKISLSKKFIHIIHIAIDIIKYNEVHTGGKTQLGGLKEGNVKLEYHGSLKAVVTNEPK